MDLEAIIAARPLNTITREHSPKTEEEYLTLPVRTAKRRKIPSQFKGQEVWDGLINPPLNQGSCGSCWAFATTGVLADRWSILTGGAQKHVLSPVKPILCDWQGKEDTLENPDSPYFENQFWKYNQAGTKAGSCFGNTLSDAWRYLFVSGTTTMKCLPYGFRGEYDIPLGDATEEKKIPLCYDVTGKIGDMCADNVYHSTTGLETGTPAKFYRAGAVYRIPNDVSSVQVEIMENGPVTTGITVYPSFYQFEAETDVYSSSANEEKVGGHAVEIVGWGVHPTQGDFWWIKNSWGCYDKYTKILTETGWRYFFQVQEGDLVATLNERRELEYHPVEEVHCYENQLEDIPIHQWANADVNLAVTYNHRMLIPNETGCEFKEAWELRGETTTTMYKSCERFQGNAPRGEFSDKFDAFATILAAFILDGSKTKKYTDHAVYDSITTMVESSADTMTVHTVKFLKIKGVRRALRELGIEQTKTVANLVEVEHEALYNALPDQTGRIPREVLDWSTEYLQVLLQKFFRGKQSIMVYKSVLASQLQELALKATMACNVTPRGKRQEVTLCDTVVECGRCELQPYSGSVYCVTVQNHCVFVQRGGKAVWSGNSDWGDKGYFRIRRGTDECGVESNVMTGLPDFFEPPNGPLDGLEREAEYRHRIDTGDHVSGGGINPSSGYSRRVEKMLWKEPLDTQAAKRVDKPAYRITGTPTVQPAVLPKSVKPETGTEWIYIVLAVVFLIMWTLSLVWVLTR